MLDGYGLGLGQVRQNAVVVVVCWSWEGPLCNLSQVVINFMAQLEANLL